MAVCDDKKSPAFGLCPEGGVVDIRCVPETNGEPNYTPRPDQIPFAFDPTTGVLWIHVCPNNWVAFQTGLCQISNTDITQVADPCVNVRLPIVFDNAGVCNEGLVTLGDLSNQVVNCIGGLGNGSVVIGGTEISVSANTVNDVTTYAVSYTGNPSSITQVQVVGKIIAQHNNGRGVLTNVRETVTDVSPTGGGGFNYTDEEGNTTSVAGETTTTVVGTSGGGFNYTNEINQVVTIPGETVTTLLPDGSGGLNYINEVGVQTNIPAAPAAPSQIFLSSVNGDTNGGTVQADSNRRFNLAVTGGQTWALQLPPASQWLDVPVTIFQVAQLLTSGNFDTTTVNLNLNTLTGVTVPAGAQAVILQAAASTSGNQDSPGQNVGVEFAHIEVAPTTALINGGNFDSVSGAPSLVTYADTNLGGDDNDNTTYPTVPLNGNNIAYRGKIRFSDTVGTSLSHMSLRVVGFTF